MPVWLQVVSAFLAAIVGIAGVWEKLSYPKINKEGNRVKRLTVFGYWYTPSIVVLLIAALYGIKILNEPSHAELEFSPLNPPKILQNPYFETTDQEGLYSLVMWFKNVGDRRALNIHDSIIQIINFKGELTYHGLGRDTRMLNEDDYLRPGADLKLPIPYTGRNLFDNSVPVYLYLRLSYTDSNGYEGVYRKILDTKPFRMNTYIPEIDHGEYVRVKQFLQDSELW